LAIRTPLLDRPMQYRELAGCKTGVDRSITDEIQHRQRAQNTESNKFSAPQSDL